MFVKIYIIMKLVFLIQISQKSNNKSVLPK